MNKQTVILLFFVYIENDAKIQILYPTNHLSFLQERSNFRGVSKINN